MQDAVCTVRLRLADAVTKARQAVYEAKALRDQVSVQGIYVARYDLLLNEAKAAEAGAIAALKTHRKEHCC